MTYERILTALADPTRRAIFEDLRGAPLQVTRLANRHPISRPAVSQHLKVLELAGLVMAQAEGTARLYRADPKGLAPLRAYLDTVWGDVLDAFADEVTQQMEDQNTRNRDQNR